MDTLETLFGWPGVLSNVGLGLLGLAAVIGPLLWAAFQTGAPPAERLRELRAAFGTGERDLGMGRWIALIAIVLGAGAVVLFGIALLGWNLKELGWVAIPVLAGAALVNWLVTRGVATRRR